MSHIQFIKEIEDKFRPLEEEHTELYWKFARTGDTKLQDLLVENEMKIHALFSDTTSFERIKEYKSLPSLSAEDARVLTIIYFQFLKYQEPLLLAERKAKIDAEISGIYATFRGEAFGKKLSSNDIKDILVNSKDNEERMKAWKASKQIGPAVKDLILERVGLCNQIAQANGFKNYYSMQLIMQELDEGELFDLLDNLDRSTKPSFLRIKHELDKKLIQRFGLKKVEDLRPWHYNDPFFQEAPQITDLNLDPYFKGKDLEKLTCDTFEKVGLDIAESLSQGDYYEKENKQQSAFCIMIGRHPDKVKVLANCRSNEYWMATMLHEFGHAAYYQYLPEKLPFFLRDVAHTNSTEAIAMLFGRLTFNRVWLEEVLGLSKDQTEIIHQDLKKQQSWHMLVFSRWVLVMVNFERALYTDPKQDLNRLWWDLVKKYQDVTMSDRDAPDWATKSHIAEAPVYYQNYILGEMSASQIQHFIEKNAPMVSNKNAGKFLKEGLFSQGALRPWNESLRFLTGESLSERYFAHEFINS